MQMPAGVGGWGEGEAGISVEGTGRERASTGLFLESPSPTRSLQFSCHGNQFEERTTH